MPNILTVFKFYSDEYTVFIQLTNIISRFNYLEASVHFGVEVKRENTGMVISIPMFTILIK